MKQMDWARRYSRQIVLDGIGRTGQANLGRAKVLVIGAGGLGSPALYYLAAAGVGTLGIADFDQVGPSNLQRQILYTEADLGRKKTTAAGARLRELNSGLTVEEFPCRLDPDNAAEIIGRYDLVVDAVDNFSTRYLINDCCFALGKPLIEGAVSGYEGILMTIRPGSSPCYRCLYPEPPPEAAAMNPAGAGILGMVAGTIGSLQALEALKVLLDLGETLSGRLLAFDGLNLRFREIPWRRRKNCPLCGDEARTKPGPIG